MSSKFFVMGIVLSFISMVFFFFLFRYQILQSERYRSYVASRTTKENTLRSLRGKIYDRNLDEPLAKNVSTYQISVIPEKFPVQEREKVAKEIASLLNLSDSFILNTIDKARNKREPVPLLGNLLYSEVIHILERVGNYPALEWKRNIIRFYPHNNSMSHVLGYVGKITKEESNLLNFRGYSIYDDVGKSGVEKQYENELRGETGEKQGQVDVFGQDVRDTEKILRSAKHGNDIVLTIDRKMQSIVEEALGDRIGAGIILQPSTGEILAMVSYPRFNPNVFSVHADEKLISNIQANRNSPLFNRALQANTAPASTFKILLQLAFYQEFPNEWNFSIFDRGYFTVGNRVFYDWYKHGRGWISASKALALSNNTFFFTLGVEKLGISNIVKYSSLFGLGKKTEIDLPGEIPGILPNPLWKSMRYREPWLDGDTANISIGQGYLTVSLMQLANILAGVVNEGTIYVPHVLKEVREQISGKTLRRNLPRVLHKIDEVDTRVYKRVKRDMRNVVVDGTAKSVITTEAVKIAAKTGTGQVFSDVDKKNYHSLFISFAPYDAAPENQLILVLWVDAINDWEWWAPKAANIIYHAIFTNSTYRNALQDLKEQGVWYLRDKEI